MDGMDFTNKAVIVTGGSSGIGAATVKLFASHGALVTIVGRNVQRLNQVAIDCEVRGHPTIQLALDLTAEGSCEEVVKVTLEKHKRIDVLVNCAGKPIISSLFDRDMEAFDELIALNLRVPYKMTQLCVPHLIKTKGNIINVFGAPIRVRPGMLPFAMIREAMAKFTTAGAMELASEGVRMNSVRTGICKTNFLSYLNISEEVKDAAYKAVCDELMPNKVPVEPEEVAKMILFTASNTCPSLTAANLCVDGGASSY